MSRRLSAVATLLPLCVLLWPGVRLAEAQDQSSATVKVYAVTAESADTRPAARIEAIDDPGFAARTAGAGATVPAEFRALAPGRYRVTASAEGISGLSMEVTLDPGEIVWIRASLRRGVSGSPASEIAVVNRWHSGQAILIRDPELGGLPSSTHTWSLIDALVPWTLVDGIDHGGTETGRRGLFGARDASWTWNSFVIDGIDLTDPDRPGGPLVYADPKAMQAVTVTSGLAPAAVAAPGAQVTFVPRRPAATTQGSVELSGTSRGMVADRTNGVAPLITRMHTFGDVNAQVSVPVTERVGAFLAARVTHTDYFERGSEGTRPAGAASLFGHVVARPTPRDEVRVVGSTARTSRALEGGHAYLGRPVDERDTFGHAQVHWNRLIGPGMVGSVAFGFSRGTFLPDLTGPVEAGVMDRVYDGPIPSPLAEQRSRRTDITAGITLPVRTFRKSWHTLRVDGSVTAAHAGSTVLAAPDIGELVAGIPSRVWQFDVPSSDAERHLTGVSWAIADDMRLGEHYAIDAGVRIDHWSGRASGAESGLSKVTLAPRLAVRSYFPSYKVAAFGALGRYHPRVPLQWLAFGDANEPVARLYRWTDPDGNGRFEPSERGEALALGGFGAPIGSIDPELRVPYTNEYVLGGEIEFKGAFVRATATIRHEKSLVRALGVGIPLSSYSVSFIPDQTDDHLLIPVYDRPSDSADQDRYLLTNPAESGLKYHALEIAYEQRITTNFRLRASTLEWWTFGPGAAPGYHVNENDQGLVGELFQDPNTLSYAKGANFFDRSYVAKVSGTYLAPRDVWISFTANYRDGQAFAGLIPVVDLVQGPEVIQSYRRGRTRFTFTMLLDARVEKRLKVGKQDAAFWLDVFNIPNLYEEIEEDPVPGPLFRRLLVLQPPRTFRAGFRIGF